MDVATIIASLCTPAKMLGKSARIAFATGIDRLLAHLPPGFMEEFARQISPNQIPSILTPSTQTSPTQIPSLAQHAIAALHIFLQKPTCVVETVVNANTFEFDWIQFDTICTPETTPVEYIYHTLSRLYLYHVCGVAVPLQEYLYTQPPGAKRPRSVTPPRAASPSFSNITQLVDDALINAPPTTFFSDQHAITHIAGLFGTAMPESCFRQLMLASFIAAQSTDEITDQRILFELRCFSLAFITSILYRSMAVSYTTVINALLPIHLANRASQLATMVDPAIQTSPFNKSMVDYWRVSNPQFADLETVVRSYVDAVTEKLIADIMSTIMHGAPMCRPDAIVIITATLVATQHVYALLQLGSVHSIPEAAASILPGIWFVESLPQARVIKRF